MKAGKVTTGFSKPYVALYHESSGTVTYTDGQLLARGVEVSVEPDVGDANKFYADNIVAEAIAGAFKGGTATFTVDGLLQDAEKMIQGLATADADGFINYNRTASAPYVGLGFIVRSISGGTTYFTPFILTKALAKPRKVAGKTQEEDVDFQTSEIEFSLFRDDSSDGTWLKVGGELATEAAAEAKIQSFFSITSAATT